jgi:hypothetical protein
MINSFVYVSNRTINCECNLSHEDLLSIIEDPKIVDKKEDAPLFYAFKMKSYPTVRDSSETICFDTLILDFDESDESMKNILMRFKGFTYYFYTSFNHMFDKNTGLLNGVEKFRIILPLDKEYSSTWFKYGIMKGIFDNCTLFKDADSACAKITQYYVPAITKDRQQYYRFRYNESNNKFSLMPLMRICNDIVIKNAKSMMHRDKPMTGESKCVRSFKFKTPVGEKTVNEWLNTTFKASGGNKWSEIGLFQCFRLCKKYGDEETKNLIWNKARSEQWTEQELVRKWESIKEMK